MLKAQQKIPDVNIHLGKTKAKDWSLLWEVGHHFEFHWSIILQGNCPVFFSLCVLAQFSQLFLKQADFCPAARLALSPQGGLSPGE